MLLTTLRTGLRQGELKALQWPSIDWNNRILTVRHSWCDYRKVLGSPKSNRERHIPIDAEVYDMLYRRRQKSGFVFVDTEDKPFNSKTLNRKLKKICASAGLRKISWHILRHSFASHLAMASVPLNAVQALLGHTNITTTMRYTHLAPSTLRTAIDALDPRRTELNLGNPWSTAHIHGNIGKKHVKTSA